MEIGKSSQINVFAGDGAALAVTAFPCAEKTAPVVVCMPAMGVEAEFYRPLANALVGNGFHAVTADLRGHGLHSVRAGRGSSYGYHEMLSWDWPAILDAVEEAFPGSPLVLLGHSLGGQLNALYAGIDPQRVTGLVLAASCTVYHGGWDGLARLGVIAGTQGSALISTVLGFFPGDRLGFAGRESAGVMRDWARNARTGVYRVDRSPHDFETALAGVRLPVFAISFADDTFAPVDAVKNLLRKMPAADIHHWHCTAGEIGARRAAHFNWVHHAEPIVARIGDWVRERVA